MKMKDEGIDILHPDILPGEGCNENYEEEFFKEVKEREKRNFKGENNISEISKFEKR